MDHPIEIIGNEKRALSRILGGGYATEEEGDWIGPYRLIAPLGEGGFGMVWRAEQTDPVQREVALKVIKRGMDTQQVLARFDHERQSLATMDHPGIAAMLDAGASVDGRPYFAMELVTGEPITHWCTVRDTPLRERLNIFAQICQAVNHAHQKGIIHRDLKPNNILVTLVDGLPRPKIIDFGIAKAMRASTLREQSMFTHADQLIGTPRYMSPEQLDGDHDIDTRSDIYSLGMVLYELLTGELPFAATSSLNDLKLNIRATEPTTPSRTSQLKSKISNLKSEVGKDLDHITLHALEKEPARRYQTALEFAEDIQRLLSDQPIHARAPSTAYVAGRWIKRHRTAFIAACLVIAAMISGTVISLWQANVARAAQADAEVQTAIARNAKDMANAERSRATTEASRARQAAKFLTQLLDRVAHEIDGGSNPQALKLALMGSEERIAALGADTQLQLQLLERVAGIYKSIGETKPLIPLLKATVATTAAFKGAASEEAYKAEVNYLKVITDHGNRITAPGLITDLRHRVEASEGRGSMLWLDTQMLLVRAQTKLKRPNEAIAAAEECIAEMAMMKLSPKKRATCMLSFIETFGLAQQFARANELLDQCAKASEELDDDALADQILNRRVLLCWNQKDFAGGAVILRQIVATLKKQHGDQSPEALDRLIELSEYEIDAEHYAQAIADANEAVRLARAAPGLREQLAMALVSLAKAEGFKGLYDVAIRHALEAQFIAKEVGKTSVIHSCTQILATLHADAGHLEEAANYYILYQHHIETEHANDKELLGVMEEVCLIRIRQGRHDDSMALAQELWSRLKAQPEFEDDTPFCSEIANLCLATWTACHAARPSDPEPANLAAWRAAQDRAQPADYILPLDRNRAESARQK
jgi:eukaryotic-like serine/threonine-protein kinase